MKVTKIKLPNGIEVEGEFSLEDLVKLPWQVPAETPAAPFAPLLPTIVDPMLCTCPTVWIFPPAVPCSYCFARGVKTLPPSLPWITIGSRVDPSVDPNGLTVGCPGIVQPVVQIGETKN